MANINNNQDWLQWLKRKLIGDGSCHCRSFVENRPFNFNYQGIDYDLPSDAKKTEFVRLPDGVTLQGKWNNDTFTVTKETGYSFWGVPIPQLVSYYTNALPAMLREVK